MPLTTADLEEYVRLHAGAGPLQFARAYRIMPDGNPYGIFSHPHYLPFLWSVYQAMQELEPAGRIAVMKAAQSGWTETAINLFLYFMATKHEGVLYMLPSDGQLGDFAQARITTMMNLSPKIREAFTSADNVGLKLGWGSSLYLRGSNASSKMREIPVGLLIRDEFDVMDKVGREHARSRLGASQFKWIYDLANPSFPEIGIHRVFLGGTQEEFVIDCPRCKTSTAPIWPDSVATDPDRLVCPNCKQTLNLEERWESEAAYWEPKSPGAPYRSFTMTQLITPMVIMSELMADWKDAEYDNTKLQVFYNYRLGLPFAAAGARIDDSVIRALPRHGPMAAAHTGPCVMGVDVGKRLYAVIRRLDGGIVWAGHADWDSLPRLMHSHGVTACGCDIRPETSEAKRFARAFGTKVTLIAYNPNAGATGRHLGDEDGVKRMTVGRTEAIDNALALIFSAEESVPENLPEEFWQHFKNCTRQIISSPSQRDSSAVAKEYAAWIESGDDHYLHAFCYSELIRRGGSAFSRSQIFPPAQGTDEVDSVDDAVRRLQGRMIDTIGPPI